jgi:hypothetical protein
MEEILLKFILQSSQYKKFEFGDKFEYNKVFKNSVGDEVFSMDVIFTVVHPEKVGSDVKWIDRSTLEKHRKNKPKATDKRVWQADIKIDQSNLAVLEEGQEVFMRNKRHIPEWAIPGVRMKYTCYVSSLASLDTKWESAPDAEYGKDDWYGKRFTSDKKETLCDLLAEWWNELMTRWSYLQMLSDICRHIGTNRALCILSLREIHEGIALLLQMHKDWQELGRKIPLSDLFDEVEKRYGPQHEAALRQWGKPVTEKELGFVLTDPKIRRKFFDYQLRCNDPRNTLHFDYEKEIIPIRSQCDEVIEFFPDSMITVPTRTC